MDSISTKLGNFNVADEIEQAVCSAKAFKKLRSENFWPSQCDHLWLIFAPKLLPT